MRALIAALVVLVAPTPLGAARSPAQTPADIVHRYLAALQAKRYADAMRLLDANERAYFRTPANFASGFKADGFALRDYAVIDVRGMAPSRIVVARERIAVVDPAHDTRVTTSVTVPYLVTGSGTRARIVDAGRPWRALASAASGVSGNLRVTVKKLALYPRTIRIVVTMQNTGSRFVTVLPYGRSILRDSAGAVYRPLETNDWHLTDRQLFLGIRLAPNTRYTGAIAFVTPLLDDRTRRFSLTLGPSVRDGGETPFSVDVDGIVARS